MLAMNARQRANAEWTEKLVFVEHPMQHPTQTILIEYGEESPTAVTPFSRQRDMLDQLRETSQKGGTPLDCIGYAGELGRFHYSGGTEGQQTHHRAHLETLRSAIGQAENIIEKAIFLVPQIVLAVTHPAECRADPQEMLEELQRQLFVSRVVPRQLDSDLEHGL